MVLLASLHITLYLTSIIEFYMHNNSKALREKQCILRNHSSQLNVHKWRTYQPQPFQLPTLLGTPDNDLNSYTNTLPYK